MDDFFTGLSDVVICDFLIGLDMAEVGFLIGLDIFCFVGDACFFYAGPQIRVRNYYAYWTNVVYAQDTNLLT
jgi:hypothetical protein